MILLGVSNVTKEYRKNLAEMFVNVLQEKELSWRKEWQAGLAVGAPVSVSTGAKYRGCNMFSLMLESMKMGYGDNRWATFVQIKDKGWKLQKGSKHATVEYWMPYDFSEKKALSWSKYKELTKEMTQEEIEDRFGLTARYYNVFNGSCIVGIPELRRPKVVDNLVYGDMLIETLSREMMVPILNDGGDAAFYSPFEDKIHLPQKKAFENEYAYNSTALHELGHATGNKNRLDRNITNSFGSGDYAFEELIAEITSCFMSVHLNIEPSHAHLDNHKAYVQSWIKSIKEKPDCLVKAIKEADRAANYMEEKAGLNKELKTLAEIKSEVLSGYKVNNSMKEKERQVD